MTRIGAGAGALIAAIACSVVAGAQSSSQPPLPADLQAFRDTYRELVEINTTLSAGNCTTAAQAMAKRLRDAGLPASDVQVIVPPELPKQGNLVAVLKGTDAKRKSILLLAHIDVVEAKRADWQRDPFKLVEENGYFYARGASDDKAMAASFVDSLVRYRKSGYRPQRDIKLALTCGEETDSVFNGVSYLLAQHRPLIDAEFALNEGSRGLLDANGKRVLLGIQVGEKVYQDFQLETTSPGGHSARPTKDNAIVRLANGLGRLGAFDFPAHIGAVTREFFLQTAKLSSGEVAEELEAAAQPNPDAGAIAKVAARDPLWNAMMRTTCIATLINGGHAPNAQPQRATANVNCRIQPGESVESIHKTIVEVIADPAIHVRLADAPGPTSPAPPLTAAILEPARKVAAKLWPGVPLVPSLSTGATDGRFLNAAGLPTYGLSGMFMDPDGNGVHGLNERIRVRSLYEGREFLYEVVKLYAGGK
jgi:acetylornithine deacetylase/succinyl-diaminopimelate desuccinylase-like protein